MALIGVINGLPFFFFLKKRRQQGEMGQYVM